MTIANATHRSLAALKLPKTVAGIVAHAQIIVESMTDNPHFPAPVPQLWVISTAIANLQNAEALALTRAKGAVETRNEKRTLLVSLLQQLRGYVQVTADEDPENGATIIESASMVVQKEPARAPRVFSAKPGELPGEVRVVAPSAGDRASYEWECSTDGGVNWLSMPPTIRASTTLEGLMPGTTVMFKYRSITRNGVSDLRDPLVCFLHREFPLRRVS